MKIRLLAITAIAVLAVSCHEQVYEGRPTIQYVRDILEERNAPERGIMPAVPSRMGDIAIVGTRHGCGAITDALMSADRFENVTGASASDGLADFAGETIAVVIDSTESDGTGLREHTVRMVLGCLDSLYSLSPYDIERMGTKEPAKIVILADPEYSAYGRFDLDTLFRSTGCGVTCLTPVQVMLDRLFAQTGRDVVNIGIIADSASVAGGVYDRLIDEERLNRRGKDIYCSTFFLSAEERRDALVSFLDKYIGGSNSRPLDAILVADHDINPETLRAEISRVSSVMSEDSMKYGKFVSESFRIISATEELSTICYRILREKNLFTHNIAKPQAAVYVATPRPDGETGMPLFVYVNTFIQD